METYKPYVLVLCLLPSAIISVSESSCNDCQEISIIKDALKTLTEENQILRREVNSLKSAVEEFKVKQHDGQTHKQSRRLLLTDTQENVGIAFSVSISPLNIVSLGQHQTIKFDKVISNLGNAFDNRTGVFTAPLQGWYVFSLTLMDNPDETQRLDVVKDGSHIFHCFVNGDEYDTASRTMVFHLNTNSKVWVQTTYQGMPRVHGNEHTSFTGFLLYRDV